jgi:hypothetical protein
MYPYYPCPLLPTPSLGFRRVVFGGDESISPTGRRDFAFAAAFQYLTSPGGNDVGIPSELRHTNRKKRRMSG